MRDGVRRLVFARGRLWLLASNPAEIIGIDLTDPVQTSAASGSTPTTPPTSRSARATCGRRLSDSDKLSRISFDGELADFPTGRGPSGIAVRKGVVWVANRTDSTLMRIDARTGEQAAKRIRIKLNPYDVAAYDDAIWVTTLIGGRIYRVTGLDG